MKERLSQLKKAIPESVDAMLITSHVNRRYFTGFASSAGALLIAKRKCYLIVDSRYFEAASEAVEGCEVILQEKLLSQIMKLLRQHKVKTLGIESRAVTVSEMRSYSEAFNGVEIATDDGVSDIIATIRAVKTESELAPMRAAQNIADRCFTHILGFIEAGRTEREIATEMELFCMREGSQKPSFDTIVASGRHSSMPHATPTDKRIETGDFVTMDFGCTVDGYCSDMTRTIAVGAVSPRQKECYETVLAAQTAALDIIGGGVKCSDVDKVARDIIDASEFKGCFGHGLGHCLGLEVHESPRCNETSKDTLLPGMVTSVEPGIYVAGQFGVRIEDCVVVTKNGCENLASSTKELIIL